MYDYVFQNGNVFDAARGCFVKRDVYVADGKIVEGTEVKNAKTVINAEGKAVVPGLIDEHLHIDINGSMIGANADTVCIPNGITSCCDGGTCGASNFPQFYLSNLMRYEAHAYAFLNVSTFGNKSLCIHNEDHDPADFRPDLIHKMFRRYPDKLRGLKVRMCRATLGEHGMSPLYRTLEIAQSLESEGIRCPVIVHYDDLPENVTVQELFDAMRPGDTVAHVFQTHGETIFLPDGSIHPSVLAAQARGVLMDDCHGRVHWSIPNLLHANKIGFLPDIISSDTVRVSEYVMPGYSLLYAMSIQNACGMSVEDVLRRVTMNPARALGIEDRAGLIAPGRPADITVLDIVPAERKLMDNWGGEIAGDRLFIPLLTMLDGRVAWRQIFF